MTKIPSPASIELSLMLRPISLDQIPYKLVTTYQFTFDEWVKKIGKDKESRDLISIEDSHMLIHCATLFSDENFFGTFKDFIPGGESFFKEALRALPSNNPFDKIHFFKGIDEIKKSRKKERFYVSSELHFEAVHLSKALLLYQRFKQYQGPITDGNEFKLLAWEKVKTACEKIELARVIHGFIEREREW
jgi:hypothetical protein